MNVCYFGPLLDHSGYGEANRHAAAALDAAGVHVIGRSVRYTIDNSDFGTLGATIKRLLANEGDYRIKILHTTPDQYPRHMEPGKYHIGHFFWETTIVPEEFAEGLAQVDEIWTGSQANVEAIRAAGVETPVFVYPQAIETARDAVEPYELPGFNGFLFYSIFEWTDRKNPQALLRAYWSQFSAENNVGLLLKTYFKNFTFVNKRMIREQINDLKRRFVEETGANPNELPPVYLYSELMDRRQIQRLHTTGDVFVSAHRGEGWGIPQVEAMLAGHPIISTNYGGVHEYLTEGENAWLMAYELTKVRGMTHSSRWYGGDQKWAEVDAAELQRAMHYAWKHRDNVVKLVGDRARKFVEDNFNLETVGRLMAERLKAIEEGENERVAAKSAANRPV